MFNDKYGLTQAVLDGLKTMTRRVITYPSEFRDQNMTGYYRYNIVLGCELNVVVYDKDERLINSCHLFPKYQVGEVVAIAQSYMDVDQFHRKGKNAAYLKYLDSMLPELKLYPGWSNKMFVKAELLPHHIRITNIKVERLQDISDDDCLREGIEEHLKGVQYGFSSNIGYIGQYPFSNPREAFAALIDRISGKGIWESNPYVWAYEFELIN